MYNGTQCICWFLGVGAGYRYTSGIVRNREEASASYPGSGHGNRSMYAGYSIEGMMYGSTQIMVIHSTLRPIFTPWNLSKAPIISFSSSAHISFWSPCGWSLLSSLPLMG